MTPIGQASPARALQASTPATIRPLAPGRYHLHVTLSADAHAHLRRLQDLMRHEIPTGDAALIIERALACLAQHVAGRQLAATRTEAKREVAKRDAAKQRSRHIPAEVKREVVRRDGGQCTFVGTRGRCQERSFLEFHHVVPFAAGGEGHSVEHAVALQNPQRPRSRALLRRLCRCRSLRRGDCPRGRLRAALTHARAAGSIAARSLHEWLDPRPETQPQQVKRYTSRRRP